MLTIDKLSYWERKNFFTSIDYLVIGAGIVGYSTAYHLRKQHPGAKIVLIERGFLPSGASSKNAGFACFGSPTELADDIEKFGPDLTWKTVEMRWEGLNYLRSLLGDEEIGLEINGSWDLITSNEIDTAERIRPMLPTFNEQLERITGEPNVYSEDVTVAHQQGFEQIVSSFNNRLEGQIDTAKLNQSFYKLILSNDIDILFGIEALNIDSDKEGTVVSTSIGEIHARKVAICTNGFAKSVLPEEDVQPARAQVLITKPIHGLKLKGTFHYQEGYYYFRNIDNRILLGGGRNLDFTGETTTSMETTERIQNELKHLLNTVILPNTPYEIDYSWAGIMGVGQDKKPIIKVVQENVYCGVRLGGMGVAIGSLVGKQVAQLMEQ